MPRAVDGEYTLLENSNYPAVPGVTIGSSAHNAVLEDIQDALNNIPTDALDINATWEARLSKPVITVHAADYGWSSSNTAAQNLTAFNLALAALATLGGRLCFPAGTFSCDPITVNSSNIELEGQGKLATVINFASIAAPSITVGNALTQTLFFKCSRMKVVGVAGGTLFWPRYVNGFWLDSIQWSGDRFLRLGDASAGISGFVYRVKQTNVEGGQVVSPTLHSVYCENFRGQWEATDSFNEGRNASGVHGFYTANNLQIIDHCTTVGGYLSRYEDNYNIVGGRVIQAFFVNHMAEGANRNALRLETATSIALAGTTTNGSTAVTGISSTANLVVGMEVTGAGIAASTTIAAIVSSTAITLSQNATASATVTLNYIKSIANDGWGQIIWVGGKMNSSAGNAFYQRQERASTENRLVILNSISFPGETKTPIVIKSDAGPSIDLVQIDNISSLIEPADAAQDLVLIDGGTSTPTLTGISIGSAIAQVTTTQLRSIVRVEGQIGKVSVDPNRLSATGVGAVTGIDDQTSTTPLMLTGSQLASGDVFGLLDQSAASSGMMTAQQLALGLGLVSSGAVMRNYTSSDTWSKPATLVALLVEVRGAGGGGGGVGSSANFMGAGGGGEGGYSFKLIPAASLGSSETVTVGAGGTAGANTGGTGGTGGTSSFGSHAVAAGGVGGVGVDGVGKTLGGAGGAGSSGTRNLTGQSGGTGFGIATTLGIGGTGGGIGGAKGGTAGSNGIAGANGGGGGGAASNGSDARVGGVGGGGYVTVIEIY